jgi:Spy/CpxP family protein refolding chaperone
MTVMKITVVVVALVVGCFSAATYVQACSMGDGASRDREESVTNKFLEKVKMIDKYQDELGVSGEQLTKIKDLKIALKKEHIRRDAEIELLKVDITSLLYADQVDVEAVNKLIDKEYSAMKAKTKKSIASYVELNSVLNKDQIAELKELSAKKASPKENKGC